MSIRTRRLTRLRDLLAREHPRSQEELAAMLRREGIEATQATLSRDLRELGVLKGPEGYTLPPDQTARDGGRDLRDAAAAYLLSSVPAGNLVILRTGPGQASALALEVDRAGINGVVGTVAGDDTIFLACRTPRNASRVAKVLQEIAARF